MTLMTLALATIAVAVPETVQAVQAFGRHTKAHRLAERLRR